MIRMTIFLLALVLSFSANGQTQVPHDFQSGTPARAGEVNENFDALEQAVDQNAAGIAQIQGLGQLSREAAQIQTGLNLTSGLRWLVVDSYVAQGSVFPNDNSAAGAGIDPRDWSNRFVASATVLNDGIIQILFNSDAAPQIADRVVLLTPVVSGAGVVWFDCSGDGATDIFEAELDCAFVDEPYEPVFVLRRQILTAFDLLAQSKAQQVIQDYYNSFGGWPASNAQAGLSEPLEYRNKFVDNLSVSAGGWITLTFGRDSHTTLRGASLVWQPTDHGASIEWICSSSRIADRNIPAECR